MLSGLMRRFSPQFDKNLLSNINVRTLFNHRST